MPSKGEWLIPGGILTTPTIAKMSVLVRFYIAIKVFLGIGL